MNEYADGLFRALQGDSTAYERLQIRICDALIQFDNGKWANRAQNLIPAGIIAAALESYNPDEPLRFNPRRITGGAGVPRCTHQRIGIPKPTCACGSTGVRSYGWNKAHTGRRWRCYLCGKCFTQEVQL